MGRRRIYNTEEERKEARRLSAKKYREKEKKRMEDNLNLNNELNRFDNIGFDVYTRTKMDKNQRQFVHDLIYESKPLYENTKVSKSHEKRKEKYDSTKAAKEMLNSLDKSIIEFRFDELNEKGKKYLYKRLAKFFMDLFDKINFDDRWVIYYQYDNKWKSRPLNVETKNYVTNQLEKEGYFDQKFAEEVEYTDEYDFFPVSIKKLMRLIIVNIDDEGNSPQKSEIETTLKRRDFDKNDHYQIYKALMKTKTSKEIIDRFIEEHKSKTYKKREGSFWAWILKFKFINLGHQMIFHKLDKETADLIQRDNCLIYACRWAGVDDDVINAMRGDIVTRTFALTKLSEIANKYNLTFEVKDERGQLHKFGDDGLVVKLLLYKKHYMINEKVNVSPFAIRNWEKIKEDKRSKFIKREDKLRIIKFNGNKVILGESFSLKKVLDALFEANYFEPIRLGSFCTFNTLIYNEKLAPMKRLEYNEKYCCRLKEDFLRN